MADGAVTTLWARAFVDELARSGVHDVIVAPGARGKQSGNQRRQNNDPAVVAGHPPNSTGLSNPGKGTFDFRNVFEDHQVPGEECRTGQQLGENWRHQRSGAGCGHRASSVGIVLDNRCRGMQQGGDGRQARE